MSSLEALNRFFKLLCLMSFETFEVKMDAHVVFPDIADSTPSQATDVAVAAAAPQPAAAAPAVATPQATAAEATKVDFVAPIAT